MRTTTLSIALLSAGASIVQAGPESYRQNAICNNDQLMRWFDRNRGLWGGYWWQSANMLEAAADHQFKNSDAKGHYDYVFDAVYRNAPRNNPMPTKVKRSDGSWGKNYTFPTEEEMKRRDATLAKRAKLGKREIGMVGRFFDDEGWWALAFIRALDVTGRREYLNEAIDIWYDMRNAGWNKHKCGGIPWNKDPGTGPVSISNELYIQVGAALSNRVGQDQKNTYLSAAIQTWEWMQSRGLLTSENLIRDGLDPNTCAVSGPYYTYNQGVILGGLTELYRATGDRKYLDQASRIADAVVRPGSPMQDSEGLLADGCDKSKSCSGEDDGAQFKGVFMRNLKKLYALVQSPTWKAFMEKNAQSIWSKNLKIENGACFNGALWGGPYKAQNPSVQACALDALSAAQYVTS